MNPEKEFINHDVPLYSGMLLQEYTYAKLKNAHGEMEDYRLDVISPFKSTGSPCPVVIFVHGGGFLCGHGDKRQCYIPVFSRSLTEAGYVVVSPEYPLFDDIGHLEKMGGSKTGAEYAAMAVDRACRFIQQNAASLNLDTSRMAIMGGSAGAVTGFLGFLNI